MSDKLTANFLQTLNAKYGITEKINSFISQIKNEVGAGYAVVSILESNGIAGFKFHIPEMEQVKFESDITDHYTDYNTPFQDHIALKPITITVSGLQGEYFYDLHPIENIVSTVSTSINLVKQFLPQITKQVQNLKVEKVVNENTSKTFVNKVIRDHNNLNAVELWSLFQQLFKLKSAQTRAFLYFEALWKSRCIFTVETSWKRYDNMAIQSITAIRDKNADITEFSITFKQMQFTQTEVVPITYAGRTQAQASATVNLGNVSTADFNINAGYNEVTNAINKFINK